MFTVPDNVRALRAQVLQFIEETVYPHEAELERPWAEAVGLVDELRNEAKAQGLWALGHPTDIGGRGLSMRDYLFVNEVIGRSLPAQVILGANTLQTALLLHKYAMPEMRDELLVGLVKGGNGVSFAVTEPGVASSDPTQLRCRADLHGQEWIVTGRKWFTSWVDRSGHVIVMCRTEPEESPAHRSFSMIVVPTSAPGFRIVRELRVLGLSDVL